SFTAAEMASMPLALVATFRAEEMGAALQALATETGVIHERLARFERDAVNEMVGGMLALRAPPAALVDFLKDESNGNAFFVAEWLRAAIADGALCRDEAGHWTLSVDASAGDFRQRIALPATVAALVERRLEGLDESSRRTVCAAAVLGRDFDP